MPLSDFTCKSGDIDFEVGTGSASGVVMKSPERSEDLKRIAPPGRPKNSKQ